MQRSILAVRTPLTFAICGSLPAKSRPQYAKSAPSTFPSVNRTPRVASSSRPSIVSIMHFGFPSGDFNEPSVYDLTCRSRRLTKQRPLLKSNYFHSMMLIYGYENEQLALDVKGTMEAAHKAINAFLVGNIVK